MLVVLVEAGLDLRVATLAAVATAIVHNFLWHVSWTWADRQSEASIVALFTRFSAANGLVSLAGNAVLTTVLVERVGTGIAAASLIAIAACAILNYTLADLLVFTRGDGSRRRR